MQQRPNSTQPQKAKAVGRGTPKAWPQHIAYLRAPCYSKNISSDILNTVVFPKPDLTASEYACATSGPYANVKITPIMIHSHPANGQFGLFACQHLAPDSFILPYLGYVHDQTDIDEASDYDLSLDRELGIGVDASKMGNEARFINDYRGVSAAANAEFRDILVQISDGRTERRMGIFVLRAGKSGKRSKGIGKGEEILVSYGKGFWSKREASQS